MTFEKWDNKLENFPPFDPTWPDEVKLNWYKTFDEILNLKIRMPYGRKVHLASSFTGGILTFCGLVCHEERKDTGERVTCKMCLKIDERRYRMDRRRK